MRHNNNPKNRKRLLEYQRRQLELANQTEAAARQRRIEGNLSIWNEQVPQSLKMARAGTLHALTIDKIQKAPIKPPYSKMIVVSGSEVVYPTYVIYTILHELIRTGFVTPSEIRKTSVLEGYNNINGMYKSRGWKDYVFDPDAKIILVEGASRHLTRLGSKGEDQFWRELTEHAMLTQKLVIISYSLDEKETAEQIPIPTLTAEVELNNRMVRNSNFIQLTQEEERKIRYEQEKAYRSI